MSRDNMEVDSDEYQEVGNKKAKPRQAHRKRRKVQSGQGVPTESTLDPSVPRDIFDELGNGDSTVTSFQDIIDRIIPDLLNQRARLHEDSAELDQNGQLLRPPTRAEVSSFIKGFASSDASYVPAAIAERKLKLIRERRRAKVPDMRIQNSETVTLFRPPARSLHPHSQTIDALSNIQTTPFTSSFLSRLQGTRAPTSSSAIAVDWETVTPWMNLMNDIRDHYVFSHPEREQPIEVLAPIVYTSLERSHLREVHGLLERVFWQGINVSDSLDHSPERCTVVALYKKLVVGVAILSSPRETYITYLAVRAGWDNARIARSMLYHLIMLNPQKDITLHVSVNNSAMLLYNRFGFKAEEFVAGFYEEYLDPNSRASKNAFRLRLRQQ